MDHEEHLSFFLEWYDPQSEQIKPYILHYYGDHTLELIERKTRRVFLKRIHVPTVNLQSLFIGASVSIYSRQLTIVEAANAYTQQQIQKQTNKATFVITPCAYRAMGRVLTAIEQSGLQVLNIVMAQLESAHITALRSNGIMVSSGAQSLTKDVSVLVEVKHSTPNILEDARARLESAGHLRDDSVLIGEFGLDRLPPLETTAVLDNCTLCLIRPRILQEGRAGAILDEILGAGFEISALKSLHFRTEDADEFFRVYKGIYRQYQEVIKYMSSTPCLALEVRGDDVVRRFRELCGPHDVQIARALRPTSLRAKFGKNTMMNAVHCTDCPEDGVLETQFVFTAVN